VLVAAVALLGRVGWLGWNDVKKSLDWELMVVLMSALAFSKVLMNSGGMESLLDMLPFMNDLSPFTSVVLIFVLTTVLTNLMTNVATVALLFPLVAALLHAQPAIHPMAGYLALAFGASNAFLTPFGYQTNLMVMGPGAYQPQDYLRFGTWVTLAYSAALLTYLYFL
jgi:di/tricarboxylate transporter